MLNLVADWVDVVWVVVMLFLLGGGVVLFVAVVRSINW